MTGGMRESGTGRLPSIKWVRRNTARALKLLGWLGTGQFGRAINASPPYYRRYVPWRLKRLIPRWLVAAARRRIPPPGDLTGLRPVELRAAIDLLCSEPAIPSLDDPIDTIVPVYNGLGYLDPLFNSLRRNTDSSHRLIVVDDDSPDPQVWPRLQEQLREHQGAVLLRNEANLGYVATVNRAAMFWHAESERGIRWDDPGIGVGWPLEGAPVVSGKDAGRSGWLWRKRS